jgi:ATP-dependent DNA helicase RecQ
LTLPPAKAQLLERALTQLWGYGQFRPHQRETIEDILQGRDSLTILPTGGGKSLCYQLPATLGQGCALVVSPLISLMADQVRGLRTIGIPATFLNSTVTGDESARIWRDLRSGLFRLLYVAPERLMTEGFLQALARLPISFVAIDEAHCISQWGHDFRPEYRQLGRLRALFPNLALHAFTATADPKVQGDIVALLQLKAPQVRVGDYFRPNLRYSVKQRGGGLRQLVQELEGHRQDSGIVYCLSRRNCEEISRHLQENGFQALPYHAGLSAEDRNANQQAFSAEECRTMVATVAFGMGVDISNLRYVFHYGLPQSLSHYQQEAGRAGRDGLPASCTLLYHAADILFWKRMLAREEETAQTKLALLQEAIRYATLPSCRHRRLVEYFGQSFSLDNCGACDFCLGQVVAMADSRRKAQMILSAVYRLGQSWGSAYVAAVLNGSADHRLSRNGHHRLSVFGLLSAESIGRIRDWISQLEAQDYLNVNVAEFNTLKLTRRGLMLLRPEKFNMEDRDLPVVLVEPPAKSRRKGKEKASTSAQLGSAQLALLAQLKQVRRDLAREEGVPAYMIFGDATLQAMAASRPADLNQFLELPGVGNYKAGKYAQVFLAALQATSGDST